MFACIVRMEGGLEGVEPNHTNHDPFPAYCISFGILNVHFAGFLSPFRYFSPLDLFLFPGFFQPEPFHVVFRCSAWAVLNSIRCKWVRDFLSRFCIGGGGGGGIRSKIGESEQCHRDLL